MDSQSGDQYIRDNLNKFRESLKLSIVLIGKRLSIIMWVKVGLEMKEFNISLL